MSISIDTVFQKSYDADVKAAYQREGSLLRGLVKTKTGVRGSTYDFRKSSKGKAATKARHGLIPVMNLDYTPVTVTLADTYAGEWVDKLDELKTDVSERQTAAREAAKALGRTSDDLIITALSGASDSDTMDTTSATTFRNSLLKSVQALQERDVIAGEGYVGVVAPSFWAWLMTVPQFASSDYVGPDLPYRMPPGMQAKRWMGGVWVQHSGLPKSGNNRTNFIFEPNSTGHAIGAEIGLDVTWHGDRAAWFVASAMSQGAVLIDGDGVVKLVVDESAALA